MSAVLGISANYHDAAAALVVDGHLVAAMQEERFSRIKNDPSLPIAAARACLSLAKLDAKDLTQVVFYENPYRKLDAQRNFVNFLAASLGDFNFPAGASVLCDIVAKDEGPDVVNGATRRRLALWSLANLGDSMKGYKALKPDEQALILARLRNEQNSPSEVRRKAAKNALKILNEFPDANDPELIAVDQTIDVASKAQDQYLRELTAYSLNF